MSSRTDQLQQALERARPLIDGIGGVIPVLSELPRPYGHPDFFVYSTDSLHMNAIGASQPPRGDGTLPKIAGVGISTEALEAKVKAIGETIERYCMSIHSKEQFILTTAADLGDQAIDLDRIARCHPDEPGIRSGVLSLPRKDVPMNWVKGMSLIDGAPRYVPAIMTYLYYQAQSREEMIWHPISTGCASHTDLRRAIFSGMMECLERDALMITWLHQLPLPRLDLGDPAEWPEKLRAAMATVEASQLHYEFFDATNDLGIPTIYALQLNDHSTVANMVICCPALNPYDAVTRIVEEACTLRLAITSYQGAHHLDRTRPEEIFKLEDCALFYAPLEARQDFEFLLNSPHQRHIRELPNLDRGDLDENIRFLLKLFQERDMEVVAVDLTTPEVREAGFWVTRVVIPQLVPMFPVHVTRFLDTPRLYSAAEAMGYGRFTHADVTPKPQPFS